MDFEQDDEAYCGACCQAWEHCQCAACGPELEPEPPTSAELWADYEHTGNEAYLPF